MEEPYEVTKTEEPHDIKDVTTINEIDDSKDDLKNIKNDLNGMDETQKVNLEPKESLICLKVTPNIKKLYTEIMKTTQYTNNSIFNVINLVEVLSSSIKDKNDEVEKSLHEVKEPLVKTVESLSLACTALQTLGTKCLDIKDLKLLQGDTDFEPKDFYTPFFDDEMVDVALAVKEEAQEAEDYDDNEDPDYMEPVSKKSRGSKKVYSCDLCSYTSKEKRYLSRHKQTHEVGRYKCEDCEFTSHEPNRVRAHVKSKHKKEMEYLLDSKDPSIRYYTCNESVSCYYKADNKADLEMHIASKHNGEAGDTKIKYEDMDEKLDIDKVKKEPSTSNDSSDKDFKKPFNKPGVPKRKKRKRNDIEEIEDDGDYQCTRCNYSTTKKIFFDDHENGTVIYSKCPFAPCEAYWKRGSREVRRNHMSTHGVLFEDDMVTCSLCPKKMVVKYFEEHLHKEHELGTPNHCPHCDKSIVSLKAFLYHVKNHTDQGLRCPICGASQKNKQFLTKHIYATHEEASCDICGLKFKNRHALTNHKWSHRADEDKVFCADCGRTFPTKGHLNAHVKYEHGTQELFCDKCDYTTFKPINLRLHHHHKHSEKALAMKEDKDTVMYCDVCSFQTVGMGKLKYHQKVEHGNFRVTCKICGLEMIKTGLSRHMKNKHTDIRPTETCKEPGCNYTTYTVWQLKVHKEKVHDGIRWPCDMCNYVGGYKGDLKRHQKKVHELDARQ